MSDTIFIKLKKELSKKLEGKDNPSTGKPYTEEEIDEIAKAQFKKDHGRNPKEGIASKRIDYNVKIGESFKDEEGFTIRGVAINATTTRNGHTFTVEELKKAAPSLKGRPLLKDHFAIVDNIVGKVTKSKFDKELEAIVFEAEVFDEDIIMKIENELIDSVSVGAIVKSIEQSEDNDDIILKGIEFVELSLVAIPADKDANFAKAGFAMAVMCALEKKPGNAGKVDDSKKIKDDLEDKKMEEENKKLVETNTKLQEELDAYKKAEEDAKAKEEFDKQVAEEVKKKLEEKEKSDLIVELVDGEEDEEKAEEKLKDKTLEELQKIKAEKADATKKKVENKTKGTMNNGTDGKETFDSYAYEEAGNKISLTKTSYDVEENPVLGR
jgi:hypothetical protein